MQTNEDRHEAAGGNKCAHDASAHLNKESEKKGSRRQRRRAKKKEKRNALAAEDEHENELLAAAMALAANEREFSGDRVENKMAELEEAKNIDMDFSTIYVNCSWVGQKILQALQVLMNLLTSMPMWLQVVVFVYLYLIGFRAYVKLHFFS